MICAKSDSKFTHIAHRRNALLTSHTTAKHGNRTELRANGLVMRRRRDEDNGDRFSDRMEAVGCCQFAIHSRCLCARRRAVTAVVDDPADGRRNELEIRTTTTKNSAQQLKAGDFRAGERF